MSTLIVPYRITRYAPLDPMWPYLFEFRQQLLEWGIDVPSLVLLGAAIVAYVLLRPRQAEGKLSPAQRPKSEASKAASAHLQRASAQNHDSFLQSLPRGINRKGEAWSHELPEYAQLHGVIHRGGHRDFSPSDPPEAYCWENEFCTGQCMPMYRPTSDPSKDKPGIYPNHTHFKGRKRQWENRFQFQFKQIPEGDGGLRFGIQLAEYVPLGAVAKRSMSVVVAALRRVVGQDLYHSPGEPSKPGQETELPTFVMPLWAFDQFIVQPAGEDPVDLSDPHFGEYGTLRVTDSKKFREDLSELKLEVGPTYTFSFWGISQVMDPVSWCIRKVLPMSIDCNLFCKRPPVTMCVYSIIPGTLTEKDRRHLESRKRYYFRIEFWSSKKPPTNRQIQDLFPQADLTDSPADQHKRSRTSFLTCCSGPRR